MQGGSDALGGARARGGLRVAGVRESHPRSYAGGAIERPEIEHAALGHEELVLVQSARHRERDGVYLDHDPTDPTTLRFLKRARGRAGYVPRSFLDDIDGILDGVEHGYGRAVVPLHLLAERGATLAGGIQVLDAKPMRSPVVLHWFRQSAYTRAHEVVRAALVEGVPRALNRRAPFSSLQSNSEI